LLGLKLKKTEVKIVSPVKFISSLTLPNGKRYRSSVAANYCTQCGYTPSFCDDRNTFKRVVKTVLCMFTYQVNVIYRAPHLDIESVSKEDNQNHTGQEHQQLAT